ncbi:retroviral-like aspartic protease family protein [Sphingomonas sp. AP4-R1]|uniref:retropepsin-like aspartic protease family protein n=1 Tax=Sphingomonas sp. AP4-R1 TaxID=2735134 RepID=UPI001493899F|nr:retropepsin-like aspartic protease [Sphingomonas sp. AP4-R1]QJU57318.1 retroviral-like aspartic protease family protein [Sphingomonas sp. AP4-R1]
MNTSVTIESSEPRRRRRIRPAADMLRRAARRADIARQLRRRDVSSVLIGIALGVAGLWMPRAIDHHAQHRARAAVVAPSDLSARPAVAMAPDPAAPTSPAATSLPRASDGLFYATALIDGQPVRFLVDTGASVVTLTADDARRLDIMPDARAAGRADTANGRAVFGWTRIDTVDVAGRRIEDVRAAVLEKDAGVSLLGQNLLSRLGTVRIEKDRLILG